MVVRGPILNPRADGSIQWIPDGVLAGESHIAFIGAYEDYQKAPTRGENATVENARGIIIPPFLDAHTHIPQHPIRGRFTEGIAGDPPEGRLLAGLNRNVFPAEGKFGDLPHARDTVAAFLRDTLSQGVVGGAAYLTVHPAAARDALRMLPESWHAGLVLMNQNCPEYLRNDEATVERDLRSLAEEFGQRSIITDRFAVACSTALRRIGVRIARDFGLRTQTHLNEQKREKLFVEQTLYPANGSYTDVYRADGLLNHRPLLAHCIHMMGDEWRMIADSQGAIMHCPTSNLLLGSGVMQLDKLREYGIDYAICTDVGASPTTSMLMEMSQFVLVHDIAAQHDGTAASGLACEALFRTTLAPARILGMDRQIGSFEPGKAMSFIEVASPPAAYTTAADAILGGLLQDDAISPASRGLIERLHSGKSVDSAALDELTAETRTRAARFQHRISHVAVNGVSVFRRNVF